MTDLIERLRYHVATMKAAGNDGMVRVLTEAADALEMAASNSRLWREAESENERLREALERIAELAQWHGPPPTPPLKVIGRDAILEIARKALKGGA